MRWLTRTVLAALVAALLTPVLLVTSTQSAQAVPVVPVSAIPPSVTELIGAGGLGVAAGTSAAGGIAGVAGALSAAPPVLAGEAVAGVAASAIIVGYEGTRQVLIHWNQWFADHPVDAGAGEGCYGYACFKLVDQSATTYTFEITPSAGFSQQSSGSMPYMQFALTDPSNNESLQGPWLTPALPEGVTTTFSWTDGNGAMTRDGFKVRVFRQGQPADVSPVMPLRPVGDPSNTTGYVGVSETDCMDVVTGAITTLTRQTPVAGPDTPDTAIPDAICPSGSRAVGARYKIVAVNASGQPVPGGTTTTNAWEPDPSVFAPGAPFEDCMRVTTPCELRPTTSTGETWQPTPNPSTGLVTPPASCKWGGYTMPASDCDPMVKEATGTDPTASPTATGTAIPQPPTDPNDAADADRCWPKGWGVFNPLEWMYKPVLCALKDAFVPRTSAQSVRDLADLAKTRTPVPQLGAIGAWFSPPSIATSCLDWALHFPAASGLPADVPVLNSCDDSNPIVKQLHDARVLLGVAVWVSVLAPLAWWAWRQYAPGAYGVA